MNFFTMEGSKSLFLITLRRRGLGKGGDALPYLKAFSSSCIHISSKPCSLRCVGWIRNTAQVELG